MKFYFPLILLATTRDMLLVSSFSLTTGNIPIRPVATLQRNSDSSIPRSTDSVSLEESNGGGENEPEPYHLVWSPGFLAKVILTTSLLFLLRRKSLMEALPNAFFSWPSLRNAALPLLASSCCIVQLLMNFVAGGCLGLNKIFGPIRPYFLALLVFLTGGNWRWNSFLSHSTRWVIALLPELLSFVNAWSTRRDRRLQKEVQGVKVRIEIPSMGCIACINKINTSLRSVEGVVSAKSYLLTKGGKGGVADVVLLSGTNLETTENQVADLERAVKSAGFTVSAIDAAS